MSTYTATIIWARNGAPFLDRRYSRAHRWRFDGGTEVPASSSPHVVPVPMSDATCVDPEEAFVASLSSCHMLFFLSFAAAQGFVVDRYEDLAEGTMEKDQNGRLAMTRVLLRPRVHYAGTAPTASETHLLHEKAHEACYLANSVRTEVIVEPSAHD